MYFKVSMRTNPQTGVYSGYYNLVESYRYERGRVCHRTMVNAGYLDDLNTDRLNLIQKFITEKAEHCNDPLFTYQETNDNLVNKYVNKFHNILIEKNKIDVVSEREKKQQAKNGKDIQKIDVNSIKNKDVREIGAEWMCYQALKQLHFENFLENQGWNDHDVHLVTTHLISRAVYPASELKTSKWIKENSSVCEITGTDIKKVTKDKLYRISNKLYDVKDALESYLSTRTNELFDIEDKIVLYDLTNTYFERRKKHSSLAKFGRSKEKRSDAKLVVLALVINIEGFIKHSSIFEGNMADSKYLRG